MTSRSCPIIPLKALSTAKKQPRQPPPPQPIDEQAVIRALDPGNAYFITTSLYWECDCNSSFLKPADMRMCEDCGAFRDESADARIGDLRNHGIHVLWTGLEALRTLDEYNTADRYP